MPTTEASWEALPSPASLHHPSYYDPVHTLFDIEKELHTLQTLINTLANTLTFHNDHFNGIVDN